ncbi:hypothetical protein GIB67_006893 [Kingdonia uniflora]|uniref:Uncharacterized protein n=1 Tax=Kingdonia uniflora TaxID=39325 RepID=A0A7J7L057_9MAGN|nr:hypothetical protein GIB67_006893 [Kingdonia uniflora]
MGIRPRISALSKGSSHVASKIAMKMTYLRFDPTLIIFTESRKGKFNVNQRHKLSRTTPTKCLHRPFSIQDSVFCMNIVTICGYWDGPDNEDGWGYVEAVVGQVIVS